MRNGECGMGQGGGFEDIARPSIRHLPSAICHLHFLLRLFVEDEDAVRGEVVVAGEGAAGEGVVHGLEEGDAHGGILVVDEEVDFDAVALPHADFHGVGHLEQRVDADELAQPDHEIVVELLVAHGADVDGASTAEGVRGDGGATGVEILRVGADDLATPWVR